MKNFINCNIHVYGVKRLSKTEHLLTELRHQNLEQKDTQL